MTKWTQLILLHPFSARHDEVTHTLSLLQKVRIVATSKLNGLDELTITVELERRWGASNREILWTEIQLQTQGVIEAATFDYSELVKVPQHQEVVLMCHSPRFDPTSCFQPSVPLHLTFVDVRKLGGNGMSVIELLATWLDIARLAASLGEASHAIEALLVQAHTFEKWALHAQ